MKRYDCTWVLFLLILGMAPNVFGEYIEDPGMQVLTRGPVHEAFAAASMTGAEAGVVISKMPYEPIAELPPDQRPEGANIAWIPGYWSWDDDRSDYIWVSGVWRDIPPGRQWVPGYWATVGDGAQWISGFWGEVEQDEVTYLPAPPEPLEAGPSSPQPAPDHVWTSGSWVWQQSQYYWQPGYWVVQRPDWVWTPAHYTWTPRGHVYVQSYWDYNMLDRGVMFAPIYYDRPVYRQPSYHYSPRIVIDLGVMVASLFVQPRSHHYYYGDYYDRRYESQGYYPWYSRQAMRYGSDPIYMHYRSQQLLHNPNWDVYVSDRFRYRREHIEARPPQTLALQVNIINNPRRGVTENIVVGRSLNEAIKRNTHSRRFTAVNKEERQQIASRGRDMHNYQIKRAEMESSPANTRKPKGPHETPETVRMQLPRSPVAARPAGEVKGARRPPPRPGEPRLQQTDTDKGLERSRKSDATAQPVRDTSGVRGQSDRSHDVTRGKAQQQTSSPRADRPKASSQQPATRQPATRGKAQQQTSSPRADRPKASSQQPAARQPATRGKAQQDTSPSRVDRPKASPQQPAARQPATRGRSPQSSVRQDTRPQQQGAQVQKRSDKTGKKQSSRDSTRDAIKRYKKR